VALTDEQDCPEDYTIVAKVVNGIPIPRLYKEALNDPEHAAK
jgi:hypothetical protein